MMNVRKILDTTLAREASGGDLYEIEVAQKQKPPEGGSQFAQGVLLQLEDLLQEGLNILVGFARRRFLVVAARKPFFKTRILWR
jgi:hypothetical protein